MSRFILVMDEKNFLLKDILKNLLKLLKPSIWSYEQFLRGDKVLEKIFYLTPVGDKVLVSKVKKLIEESQLRIINPIELQLFDKSQFDEIFAKSGVVYPESIVTKSSVEAMDFIRKHKIAIIKSRNDCGGSGHFVVRDGLACFGKKRLLLNFEEGMGGKREVARDNLIISPPFYIQKFLLPDDNCVWRAYVVGSEVKFFSVRKRDSYESDGDYVINVARGAKYYFPQQDESLARNLCNSFAKNIGLQIGAIDFIFHQGSPYFLEVNCEGIWILICRKFYEYPEYNPKKHNFDKFISEFLFDLSKKA